MSSEMWFLVYALAVYRLAELVSKDRIFDAIRRKTAKNTAAGGAIWKAIADWIHCPLCIGVWFSLPAAVFYSYTFLQPMHIVDTFVLWLGMAGFQYFLSSRDSNKDSV